MRITLPSDRCTVLRRTRMFGNSVCLIERKLNQNPVYFVVYKGTVIHMGTQKHCVRKFNRYVLPGYTVEFVGRVAPNYLTY